MELRAAMTFREKLKAQRKRLRRSQEQAAALFADLSVRVWNDWERESNPKEPPLWVQALILDKLRAAEPMTEGGQFDKRGRPEAED